MGQNRKKHRINSHLIIHCPTSKGVSKVSAAERASEASRVEQVNKWAVRANERRDKRVAQYFSLCSWLFWPTVPWRKTLSNLAAKTACWSLYLVLFLLQECASSQSHLHNVRNNLSFLPHYVPADLKTPPPGIENRNLASWWEGKDSNEEGKILFQNCVCCRLRR